jgi:hypothetical protein
MNARLRQALSVVLLAWGLYDLSHPGRFTLLDGVDLAIHETGHLVFAPFGEMAGVAGGTLMQLLMPALFAGDFWRRGDRHAASIGLWWLAQSAGNVATYLADARAQELPLVGGGEHDWAWMLAELDLLSSDAAIARGVRVAATLLMIGATIWGVRHAASRTGATPLPAPS